MRVLVTGASGFLGSHVADVLSKDGHDVRVLVRKTSNRKFLETLPRIEFAEGSVENADAVDAAVTGVDAIVHSAGLVKARSDDEFMQVNVEGTRNLASAAKKFAPALTRFVHVSSQEAAGPSKDGNPIAVDQEMPLTRYGRSKLQAEKVLLGYAKDFPVTILRPGGIYGPRDQEIADAFRSVKRGVLPITGDGTTKYSLVYGPDCATACARAITADVPSGSIFFVSDGAIYTQREMMEAIERAWDKRAFLRFGLPLGVIKTVSSVVEAYGSARNKAVMLTREKAEMLGHHWVCSSEDTQKALDWHPSMQFPEGAKATAKWYAENKWM